MTTQACIFSVSELNAEVADLLRSGFPALWVEGELSNFSQPASGHFYFSLKDKKAQLRCAMFKNRNRQIAFQPSSGMKVVVRGRIGLYEARGDYQLIIEHMEEAGEGDLQRQFDALKERLANEGLFADSNKQTIPAYPQQIGVISSATGAAFQDIKQVLQRRSPHVLITLYPVLVQGEEAAKQIAKAIEQACYEASCDVLIVSRGGGSLEDLWAFNEEIVARAIAASDLPIISGIGHEVDFTMADFVADIRAPTPSVAAELAAPERDELILKIKAYRNALQQGMSIKLSRSQEQLEWLSVRLKQHSIEHRLQQYHQRLDELAERQKKTLNRELIKHQQALFHLTQRLILCSPQKNLIQQQARLNQLKKSLIQRANIALQQSAGQLGELSGRLNTVSPLATLQRGYSLVRKKGRLVQSVDQVTSGDPLELMVSDGQIKCVVE